MGWPSEIQPARRTTGENLKRSCYNFGAKTIERHPAMNDTEILFIIEESPEGGFVARGIGADIVTEGDTLDQVRAKVREAVECHFDEGKSPRLVRLHFVRDEVLAV